MANSSYIDKAKAGASKTMLKELPRILWESAAIGENKYKYIKPDGEELTIEMNDTDAKSLAYAATKMAERLIELSNKTDGFFGPAIENVEGKSYENAWRIMRPLMGNENARFWDADLWAITVQASVWAATPDSVEMRGVTFGRMQKKVLTIAFNMASMMQQDKRFLHRIRVLEDLDHDSR